MIVLDERGRIVLFNRACETVSGYRAPEVLGQELLPLLIVNEERTSVQGVVDEMVAGASRTRHENFWRARDGQLHRIEWSNSSIHGPDGRVKYLVGTGIDITQRREFEERIRLHEEQLRQGQKLEAIGRLAGGLAHDFNNLLTTILGHSQIVLAEHAGDERLRRDIEAVLDAAALAASLTRQLLAFGRGQPLELRVVHLGAIVSDMATLLRRVAGDSVDLQIDVDPELGWVLADPTQIRQTVVNLALNARDAMPAGGSLSIRLRNRGMRSDSQHALPAGDYVQLEITDTGTGMDADTLAHLFEPFFTTKEAQGTGLGLATVYGIVKQSGGHVFVTSEPDRGATFAIYFPRVQGGADSTPEA